MKIFISLATSSAVTVPCEQEDEGCSSRDVLLPPFSFAVVESVGSVLNGRPLIELRDLSLVRPPTLGARRLQRVPVRYRVEGDAKAGVVMASPSDSVGALLAAIAVHAGRDDLWELVDVDGLAVSEDVLVREFASVGAATPYLVRARPPEEPPDVAEGPPAPTRLRTDSGSATEYYYSGGDEELEPPGTPSRNDTAWRIASESGSGSGSHRSNSPAVGTAILRPTSGETDSGVW